jgi:hypothetical protein
VVGWLGQHEDLCVTDSLPVSILNHLLPNRLVGAGAMSSLVFSAMRLAGSRVTPHSREAEGVAKIGIGPGLACCPIGLLSTSHRRTASELLALCIETSTQPLYTFVECLN